MASPRKAPISVEIETATIAVLDEITAIEQECFSTPWDRAAFRQELEGTLWSRTLIAKRERRVVGYLTFWTVADEYQLLKIAVRPSLRTKKIGHRLLQALCRLARTEGVSLISLELRESNVPARRLYDRCGFGEVGRRSGYYTDTGEDAILMNCEF